MTRCKALFLKSKQYYNRNADVSEIFALSSYRSMKQESAPARLVILLPRDSAEGQQNRSGSLISNRRDCKVTLPAFCK